MKYLKLYEYFSQNSPIGIIDSGYGGVAILKVKQLFGITTKSEQVIL